MGGRKRGPVGIVEQVDHGTAELLPDGERPGAFTLMLDGYPQSYVDLDDPAHLEFEYIRRLAAVIDFASAPAEPLHILHLGGGALTLPRYVARTRPKSMQRVVERDAALIALVRRELPLPRGADLRVRQADARAAVEATAAGKFDLVIVDVYGGARIPSHLATIEFATAVARVLRPDGIYAANLADGPPLNFARAQVATLTSVFADVCMMAEPNVLRGRRFGNLVVAASLKPARLPVADFIKAAARDPFPARVLHGVDLDKFIAGVKPMTDANATDSPPPPESLFR